MSDLLSYGHRDAFNELDRVRPQLAAKDHGFADSLLSAFRSKRGWSDKQAEWARKLADRVNKPAPEPAQIIADLAPIVAIFDRAGEKLKRPFLMISAADIGALRLSIAGPDSRNAGDVYLAGKGSFERRAYYGRIDKAGRFWPGRDASGQEAAIKAALAEFAKDPAAAAAAYGKAHGSCCFCARALSDGRSVLVGYGPECASKWGLPWGEKVAA